MGCWDKVEAANFPVKIGASYTWGNTDEVWDFDFIPPELYTDEMERPGKFEGLRRQTSFQVDRAKYDKILLDHTEEMGVTVKQGCGATTIERDGDRVTGVVLEDGTRVAGKHYVDASGAAGVIRKAMGIQTKSPEMLRNVAIWGYWTNAEWALKIGTGGTRVQVRSLPYGWIWFIPMGPERTSVGLIVHADYYKEYGLSKEDLYHKALKDQTMVGELLKNATFEGEVSAIKDWSFAAERLVGENWFLIGESAGSTGTALGRTAPRRSTRSRSASRTRRGCASATTASILTTLSSTSALRSSGIRRTGSLRISKSSALRSLARVG
jgi:flavin-dependent dehydrogenase